MAKKARWENDRVGFDNPFAVLKNACSSSDAGKNEPSAAAPKKETRLPGVRSARLERAGRGGKTVTRVFFHGQPDEDAMRAWLKYAKTTLGIGGNQDESGVFLQGDQVARLRDAGIMK